MKEIPSVFPPEWISEVCRYQKEMMFLRKIERPVEFDIYRE